MEKVSEEVSEGVLLWNASLVLKAFLEDKARAEFDGASVLELGAAGGPARDCDRVFVCTSAP